MIYPINADGIYLLKDYEKFAKTTKYQTDVATAYWDDLGKVWTIAWGFTLGVRQGDKMTLREAEQRLAHELEEDYVAPIIRACTYPPNANELAAMACFAWNIGMGWEGKVKPRGAKDGFRQSTVLRVHNRGDKAAASRAFGLWNKAGGREVLGLTRRRAAESVLYLKGRTEHIQMPQVVDTESKMTQSPINIAAAGAGSTSALGLITQFLPAVTTLKDDILVFLPIIGMVAGIVVMALVSYVIFKRYVQRDQGWV